MKININNFESEVIKSEKLTFLKLSTPVCPPCRVLATYYKKVGEKFPQFNFYEVDCYEDTEIAKKFGITRVPTILVFNKGEKISEFGFLAENKFIEKIETYK